MVIMIRLKEQAFTSHVEGLLGTKIMVLRRTGYVNFTMILRFARKDSLGKIYIVLG